MCYYDGPLQSTVSYWDVTTTGQGISPTSKTQFQAASTGPPPDPRSLKSGPSPGAFSIRNVWARARQPSTMSCPYLPRQSATIKQEETMRRTEASYALLRLDWPIGPMPAMTISNAKPDGPCTGRCMPRRPSGNAICQHPAPSTQLRVSNVTVKSSAEYHRRSARARSAHRARKRPIAFHARFRNQSIHVKRPFRRRRPLAGPYA